MQAVRAMNVNNDMVVKSVSVPVGLEELMESLTREVLRKKPSDVYTFAFKHFDRLLGLREEGCYKAPPIRNAKVAVKTGNDTLLRKSKTMPAKQISRQAAIAQENVNTLRLVGTNKKIMTKSEQSDQKPRNARLKVLEKRKSRKSLEKNAAAEEKLQSNSKQNDVKPKENIKHRNEVRVSPRKPNNAEIRRSPVKDGISSKEQSKTVKNVQAVTRNSHLPVTKIMEGKTPNNSLDQESVAYNLGKTERGKGSVNNVGVSGIDGKKKVRKGDKEDTEKDSKTHEKINLEEISNVADKKKKQSQDKAIASEDKPDSSDSKKENTLAMSGVLDAGNNENSVEDAKVKGNLEIKKEKLSSVSELTTFDRKIDSKKVSVEEKIKTDFDKTQVNDDATQKGITKSEINLHQGVSVETSAKENNKAKSQKVLNQVNNEALLQKGGTLDSIESIKTDASKENVITENKKHTQDSKSGTVDKTIESMNNDLMEGIQNTDKIIAETESIQETDASDVKGSNALGSQTKVEHVLSKEEINIEEKRGNDNEKDETKREKLTSETNKNYANGNLASIENIKKEVSTGSKITDNNMNLLKDQSTKDAKENCDASDIEKEICGTDVLNAKTMKNVKNKINFEVAKNENKVEKDPKENNLNQQIKDNLMKGEVEVINLKNKVDIEEKEMKNAFANNNQNKELLKNDKNDVLRKKDDLDLNEVDNIKEVDKTTEKTTELDDTVESVNVEETSDRIKRSADELQHPKYKESLHVDDSKEKESSAYDKTKDKVKKDSKVDEKIVLNKQKKESESTINDSEKERSMELKERTNEKDKDKDPITENKKIIAEVNQNKSEMDSEINKTGENQVSVIQETAKNTSLQNSNKIHADPETDLTGKTSQMDNVNEDEAISLNSHAIKTFTVEMLNKERLHLTDATNISRDINSTDKELHSNLTVDADPSENKEPPVAITKNSENNDKVYDPSTLRRELETVQKENNLARFKTSYNPYILRQEIRNVANETHTDATNDDARKSVNETKQTLNLKDQISSVIKIQSLWRGYKVRKQRKNVLLGKQFEVKEDSLKRRVLAVLKIQAVWKGHRARKGLKKVNQETSKGPDKQNQNEKQSDLTVSTSHNKIVREQISETAAAMQDSGVESSDILKDTDDKKVEKDVKENAGISTKSLEHINIKDNKSIAIETKYNDMKSVDSQNDGEKIKIKTDSLDKIENNMNKIQSSVTLGRENLTDKKTEEQKIMQTISSVSNKHLNIDKTEARKQDVKSTYEDLKDQKELATSDFKKGSEKLVNHVEDNAGKLLEQTADQAASKIQAGVRGYLARKNIKDTVKPIENVEKLEQNSVDPTASKEESQKDNTETSEEPSLDQAASKIQADVCCNKLEEKSDELVASKTIEKPSENMDTLEKSSKSNEKLEEQSVDDAASKIQAGVRGYLVRKKLKEDTEKPIASTDKLEEQAVHPAALKTEKPTENTETLEEESVDQAVSRIGKPSEKSEEKSTDEAALIIQADVRGDLVPKNLKEGTEKPAKNTEALEEPSVDQVEVEKHTENIEKLEEKSVDQATLKMEKSIENNEKLEQFADEAASKIQAGVRGYLVRKNIKGDTEKPAENTKPLEEKSVNQVEAEDSVKPIENIDKLDEKSVNSATLNIEKSSEITENTGKLEKRSSDQKLSKIENPTENNTKLQQSADEAASKIQAGVRGYLVRKNLKEDAEKPIEITEKLEGKSADSAALKIEKQSKSNKKLEDDAEDTPKRSKNNEKQHESQSAEKTGDLKALDKAVLKDGVSIVTKSVQFGDELKDNNIKNDLSKIAGMVVDDSIQSGIEAYSEKKNEMVKNSNSTASESVNQTVVDEQLDQPLNESSEKELHDAASKIQAGVKGYLARKNMDKHKGETNEPVEKDKDVNDLKNTIDSKGNETKKVEGVVTRKQILNHGNEKVDGKAVEKQEHNLQKQEDLEKAQTIDDGSSKAETDSAIKPEVSNDHREISSNAVNELFQKMSAAVLIQSYWRGFRTRKNMKDLMVANTSIKDNVNKTNILTSDLINLQTDSEKSNSIGSSLTQTTAEVNNIDLNNEQTMNNAAASTQFGVRGDLTRKNVKETEDQEAKGNTEKVVTMKHVNDLQNDKPDGEGNTGRAAEKDVSKAEDDEKRLTDDEIQAGLKLLDGIHVPSETPTPAENVDSEGQKERPKLERSITVDEPVIERKHVSLLGKSYSVDPDFFKASAIKNVDGVLQGLKEESKEEEDVVVEIKTSTDSETDIKEQSGKIIENVDRSADNLSGNDDGDNRKETVINKAYDSKIDTNKLSKNKTLSSSFDMTKLREEIAEVSKGILKQQSLSNINVTGGITNKKGDLAKKLTAFSTIESKNSSEDDNKSIKYVELVEDDSDLNADENKSQTDKQKNSDEEPPKHNVLSEDKQMKSDEFPKDTQNTGERAEKRKSENNSKGRDGSSDSITNPSKQYTRSPDAMNENNTAPINSDAIKDIGPTTIQEENVADLGSSLAEITVVQKENSQRLVHSSEFHDAVVLPPNVYGQNFVEAAPKSISDDNNVVLQESTSRAKLETDELKAGENKLRSNNDFSVLKALSDSPQEKEVLNSEENGKPHQVSHEEDEKINLNAETILERQSVTTVTLEGDTGEKKIGNDSNTDKDAKEVEDDIHKADSESQAGIKDTIKNLTNDTSEKESGFTSKNKDGDVEKDGRQKYKPEQTDTAVLQTIEKYENQETEERERNQDNSGQSTENSLLNLKTNKSKSNAIDKSANVTKTEQKDKDFPEKVGSEKLEEFKAKHNNENRQSANISAILPKNKSIEQNTDTKNEVSTHLTNGKGLQEKDQDNRAYTPTKFIKSATVADIKHTVNITDNSNVDYAKRLVKTALAQPFSSMEEDVDEKESKAPTENEKVRGAETKGITESEALNEEAYQSAPTRPVTSNDKLNSETLDSDRPLSMDSTTSNDSLVTVIYKPSTNNDTTSSDINNDLATQSKSAEERSAETLKDDNSLLDSKSLESVNTEAKEKEDEEQTRLKRNVMEENLSSGIENFKDSEVNEGQMNELKNKHIANGVLEDVGGTKNGKQNTAAGSVTGDLEGNDGGLVNSSAKEKLSSSKEESISSQGLVQTGELVGSPIPLARSDPAAGVSELTSRRSATTHASTKVGFAAFGARTPPNGVRTRGEMEEKRINASLVKKSAEAEAATKIQASFRGYQVRKQLKLKNGDDGVTMNRRICKRKNSGRIRQDSSNKNQQNKPSDLEVRSATKIQAGIRGFLVRKRQKNTKPVAQAS